MPFRKHHAIVFFQFLFMAATCFSYINCNNDRAGNVTKVDGKSLSEKYCQSCHQYPGAEMLDQETWTKHVLPAMAPHLGIQVYAEDQYVNNPSNSIISYVDWLKIVDYYKSASPKALKPARVPVKPVKDWGVFTLLKPAHDSVPLATTTMIAFDTISHRIFTGDMLKSSIYQWSSDQLKLQNTRKFNSPAVNVQFIKDDKGAEHGAFTFIGTMDAVDVTTGYLADIDLDKPDNIQPKVIADSLPRPVQSLRADFNKDGLTDWLICGFGHNKGGLYWYKQLPDKKFQKNIISTIPGAEHAVIEDFNHDGWPDIACLFAQADEGIWLFLSDHKGGFTTSNLLRFPPVYGSSSFQLIDFNHDGNLDILYTSGDNSDYSKILKPFHGVYIYLNQGNFKYKQAYFYPVNGATKAVAADFNGDGKLDIALIAFFSDLKNNPAEGFTYFEQDRPMHFIPHNLPIAENGRWICMDVADYNADGRPDILLGNFSFGFINDDNLKPNWNTHIPFVILQNISNKHQKK